MAEKLGPYQFKLAAEIEGFTQDFKGATIAIGRFGVELENIRKKSDKTSGFLEKLRKILAGFAAIVGGIGFVSAIKSALRLLKSLVERMIEFEDALTSSIAIVSGVTDEMREQYRRTAIEISEYTKFTADEAASGFYFLASAGFSAEAQIAALPIVADFATAGFINMEDSVTLLADSMAAMGLRSEDLQENLANMSMVADQITEANVMSNASIYEFARALQNKVAASAKLANRPLEEVLAALTIFADKGIKGRVAGNRLNIVFRELQAKAILNAEAFDALGISVFDATTGAMRPFYDILADVDKMFSGVSNRIGRARLLTLGFTREMVDSLLTFQGLSEEVRKRTLRIAHPRSTTGQIAERTLSPIREAMNGIRAEWDKIAFLTRVWADDITNVGNFIRYLLREIGKEIESKGSVWEGLKAGYERVRPLLANIFEWMKQKLIEAISEAFSNLASSMAEAFSVIKERGGWIESAIGSAGERFASKLADDLYARQVTAAASAHRAKTIIGGFLKLATFQANTEALRREAARRERAKGKREKKDQEKKKVLLDIDPTLFKEEIEDRLKGADIFQGRKLVKEINAGIRELVAQMRLGEVSDYEAFKEKLTSLTDKLAEAAEPEEEKPFTLKPAISAIQAGTQEEARFLAGLTKKETPELKESQRQTKVLERSAKYLEEILKALAAGGNVEIDVKKFDLGVIQH